MTTFTLVLLACAAQGTAAADSYVRNYGFRWSVGGQSAGPLKSWEGGDLRAGVVVDEKGVARVGPPRREDIRCTLPITADAVLQDWLRGALAGSPARDLALFELERNGSTARVTQHGASALNEIVFPACDADERDVEAILALKIAPATAQVVANAPAPAATSTSAKAKLFTNMFALSIDGLDAAAVVRVSSIKAQIRPEGVQVSTIVIRLIESPGSAGWRSWFEASIEKGNPTEKNGRLEFGAGGVPLAVQLQGLGILRMSRTRMAAEGNAGTVNVFEIELTCKKLGLDAPGAPAVAPAAAPDVAKPAAGHPDDKGERDPADFPRAEGTVRAAYFSSRAKTGTTETATYASKSRPEELAVVYEKTLADGGWERVNRFEAGDKSAGTYSIVLSLKKATRAAQVSLRQAKSGGTDLSVSLSEDLRRLPKKD